MKKDQSNDREAPLKAVLREWEMTAPLPPRFQEQVWRRVERAETAAPPAVSLAGLLSDWIVTLLPRPALATAYVAVLLAAGAGFGWNQARREAARITDQLGARYAQAVDPYQGVQQP
jgi:hypothetical protein